MDTKTRLYIAGSFVLGIVLTLGFKDVYPDLEHRFHLRRRRRRFSTYLTSWTDNFRKTQNVALRDNTNILLNEQSDQEPFPSAPRAGHTSIVHGIEGTIGKTPLILIPSLSAATGCTILAKAEFLNGAGNSPKDRVALHIIRTLEADGVLVPHRGDTIYEGTVGSTGISLAALARARGYNAHICMPADQSAEKAALLERLGATVERVPPASIVDSGQFVNRARARAAEHTDDPNRPGRGVFADQFENEANWQAHFEGTGPEIYTQTGGQLDAFVAGAGTGGTISGVARFLKPLLPGLRVVLADPQGSGLYNRVKYGVMFAPTEREGTRRRQQVDSIVEGIGVNRVTANFEAGRELVDDAVRVTDEQALRMARWMVEKDGIFVGSSSAVNCVAAVVEARRLGKGSTVVTVLCDSGVRHLSKFWKEAGELEGELNSLDDVLGA